MLNRRSAGEMLSGSLTTVAIVRVGVSCRASSCRLLRLNRVVAGVGLRLSRSSQALRLLDQLKCRRLLS
jgi:hypothetical protein